MQLFQKVILKTSKSILSIYSNTNINLLFDFLIIFYILFKGLTCAGVTQKLREEQANTEAYIIQINSGTTFPKKQKTLDYDKKILNLVENYNKLEIESFIYNISLLMSQKRKIKNPLI
jgi:hypothetical protein